MDKTNSTTDNHIISSLSKTGIQLNIYFGLLILLTGNINAIGNFVVFSSRTFRTRACSVYLVAESIYSFFYLNSVLSTRIIQKGFQFPILNRYDSICRIRQFLAEYLRQVAFVLFTLATIDRILLTHRSPAYRRWSNRVSLAYKLTAMIASVWFLLLGHRLIFFNTASGVCRALAGSYETFDVYFEIFMSAILPPLLLIILGGWLLRNIRQVSRKKIAPVVDVSQSTQANVSYIQQIEEQITKTLLLQSFVAIFSFCFFGAENIYSTVTETWYKSHIRLAWEKVVIEVSRLLAYLFFSTSFYISLVANRGFRRQALDSLGIKRDIGSTNLIHPLIVPTNSTKLYKK